MGSNEPLVKGYVRCLCKLDPKLWNESCVWCCAAGVRVDALPHTLNPKRLKVLLMRTKTTSCEGLLSALPAP